MIYSSQYNLGDTVYLKTDEEQKKRIITGIQVRPSGCTFALSNGTAETWHYDFEFSYEIDNVMKTT